MQIIETIIVAFVILSAIIYLYKTFKPKENSGSGCGCGTTDCKVPKPKIEKK